jgi:pyridoxine kinase
VILTGVSLDKAKTGIAVYKDREATYYEHERASRTCHGTGDIYASVFTGALVRGKTPFDAASIAADFTLECVKLTANDDEHWYGARFEPILYKLSEMIEGK